MPTNRSITRRLPNWVSNFNPGTEESRLPAERNMLPEGFNAGDPVNLYATLARPLVNRFMNTAVRSPTQVRLPEYNAIPSDMFVQERPFYQMSLSLNGANRQGLNISKNLYYSPDFTKSEFIASPRRETDRVSTPNPGVFDKIEYTKAPSVSGASFDLFFKQLTKNMKGFETEQKKSIANTMSKRGLMGSGVEMENLQKLSENITREVSKQGTQFALDLSNRAQAQSEREATRKTNFNRDIAFAKIGMKERNARFQEDRNRYFYETDSREAQRKSGFLERERDRVNTFRLQDSINSANFRRDNRNTLLGIIDKDTDRENQYNTSMFGYQQNVDNAFRSQLGTEFARQQDYLNRAANLPTLQRSQEAAEMSPILSMFSSIITGEQPAINTINAERQMSLTESSRQDENRINTWNTILNGLNTVDKLFF